LVNALEFETVLDTNAGVREDVTRTVEVTLKADTPDEYASKLVTMDLENFIVLFDTGYFFQSQYST